MKYAVLCLLLAAAAIAAIRLYPAGKAAFILGKAPALNEFTYNIDVNLRRENLTEGQTAFADALSWLLGVEGEKMMALKVTGSYCQDTLYAQITCEGVDEPLTDIWLSGDSGYMNAKQLYSTIRSRLTGQYSLLEFLLPEWKYEQYISIGQIEEIFGISLGQLYALKDSLPEEKGLLIKGFGILASMDGKADAHGVRFTKSYETADVLISVSNEDGTAELGFESTFKEEQLTVSGCRAAVSFGNVEAVNRPDSIMPQEVVDKFAAVWSVLADLKGKMNELIS